MEAEILYHADQAIGTRAELAGGQAPLRDRLARLYQGLYPGLVQAEIVEAADLEDRDALRIRLRAAGSDFWSLEGPMLVSPSLMHLAVASMLEPPKMAKREHGYFAGVPGRYEHRIEVRLPDALLNAGEPPAWRQGDRFFEIDGDTRLEPDRAERTLRMRLLTDYVPPADWPVFLARANEARQRAGFSLRVRAIDEPERFFDERELSSIARRVLQDRRFAPRGDRQREDYHKLARRTLLLEGGRLPPKLRAETLRERAIALGRLGRLEREFEDLETALEILPQDAETLMVAIENAAARGDADTLDGLLPRIEHSGTVEQRARARRYRGELRYRLGEPAAALAELQSAARELHGDMQAYAAIWAALSARALGEDPEQAVAGLELHDASEWSRSLLDAVLGRLSERALLERARQQPDPRAARCEAHYYLGELALLADDRRAAKSQFKKAIRQGALHYFEHAHARWRLRQLD